MLIQMDVSDLTGVQSATADHRTGITEVTYDDQLLGPDEVVHTIVKAGYGAELLED